MQSLDNEQQNLYRRGALEKAPPNRLILSIISILVGFSLLIPLIFGVIALVFSITVNSDYKKGYVCSAKRASRMAMLFGIISLVLSVLFYSLLAAFLFIMMHPPYRW